MRVTPREDQKIVLHVEPTVNGYVVTSGFRIREIFHEVDHAHVSDENAVARKVEDLIRTYNAFTYRIKQARLMQTEANNGIGIMKQ